MIDQPKGDKWNIKDTDDQSQHYGKTFIFDFSFILSNEIKEVIKDYVWSNYRTGSMMIRKMHDQDMSCLKYICSSMENRRISSLRALTNEDIENFMSYTRTVVSSNTKKPLSYQTQKKCLDTLKSIIRWGQIHRQQDVPCREIFTGNEYPGIGKKIKIKFIPDEVLAEINKALENEENPYIKYGIIILESTGMRLGDLLLLDVNCIHPHPISGDMITWFDHKNRRARPLMPVRSECAAAVEKLREITADMRKRVDNGLKQYLFIHEVSKGSHFGEIMRLNQISYQNWLDTFITTHGILGQNGMPYHITAHMFRRTLATDMLSKGTNINVIQKVLGHSNPSVTKLYYAAVKDKERAERFATIGVIGDINMIGSEQISDSEYLTWFKVNMDKCVAGLCDGYCTKPMENGKICDRLLKRQRCYTCNRYITTPEYLEVHRSHLRALEEQLRVNAVYGEHYAEHFRPTIKVLKEIISRLESIQDGGNESCS